MKHRYLYAIIIIITLFFIEQYLQVPYAVKALIKIALFLSPLFFIKEAITLKPTKQTKLALLLSVILIGVVLGAYYALQSFIDLSTIASNLANIGITKSIFIIIAIYIIVGNAFIEEYFFRGFLKSSPIISSIIFSVYHITIFIKWFSPVILALALIGLFIGGLIFHWVNKKQTLLNGLIVHIGADIAIIIVGLLMFGFF